MTSDGHRRGSGLSAEHVSQSIDWATLVVMNLYNCSFHSSGTLWFLQQPHPLPRGLNEAWTSQIHRETLPALRQCNIISRSLPSAHFTLAFHHQIRFQRAALLRPYRPLLPVMLSEDKQWKSKTWRGTGSIDGAGCWARPRRAVISSRKWRRKKKKKKGEGGGGGGGQKLLHLVGWVCDQNVLFSVIQSAVSVVAGFFSFLFFFLFFLFLLIRCLKRLTLCDNA